MSNTTTIAGSFPTAISDDENLTINHVLNTGHANNIMFQIAHDNKYRPPVRIGRDEKGITSVAILRYDEWKMWGREDFDRHRIHDPHTLGAVYGYDRPAPDCNTEYILSEENIEYCQSKYSISIDL